MTDLPRPAPAHFPYREHRTLAEVDRQATLNHAGDALGYAARFVVPPSVRIR